MKKKILYSVVILVIAVGVGIYFLNKPALTPGSSGSNGIEVTIYKSQLCSCCSTYVSELKRQGFDVKVVNTDDRSQLFSKYSIPRSMGSCHTSIIGNYFVEGHVPVEALNKLSAENPDIDGIALPGMPAGSPGMPGRKAGAFEIYSIKNGQSQGIFAII